MLVRRFTRSFLWALPLAVALAPGCAGDSNAPSAIQIQTLDQAIGGPVAYARTGDFLLQNDQIRAVIEGGRSSRLPLDVGGTLIDLDWVRTEAAYRGGKGLDLLGQIAPVVNLDTPRAVNATNVRITGSARGAEVTAAATGDGLLKIIGALDLLIKRDFPDEKAADKDQRLYTEYELRKGEKAVRLTTTIGYGVPFCPVGPEDGCGDTCDDALYDDDCTCSKIPDRCAQGVRVVEMDNLPDRPVGGLLDVVLGDLPRPLGTGSCNVDTDCAQGSSCVDLTQPLGGKARVCRAPAGKDSGVFGGDMLIFGGHLAPFVPGTGYDTDTDIHRLFDKGGDTLATPLVLPEVIATGDRVSYAYGSKTGQIEVPIFGGPFSLGATAGFACRHDQPGCIAKTLLRYGRFVAVGTGDASSAHASLASVRGDPTASVFGHVILAHTSAPLSNVDVYALKDPRDLPCDGECASRCAAVTPTTDAQIAAMSLDDLFAANKCRSHSAIFLEGTAQIETVAKTDPGVDPVKDGDYRIVLAPGRHVLVAQNGGAGRSALVPVSLGAGESKPASFEILEPGHLSYATFNEKGEPVAARVTVGACFPGKACAKDEECGAGEACLAGGCACPQQRLRPIEMGGDRFADGALTIDQTRTGAGRIDLPPGDYDVLFSHGPHSTEDVKHVHLDSGIEAQLTARLTRVVDKTDWSASDFHVHAGPSMDSGLPLADRATSFLAEEMDFMSSSDHDVLTRYLPLLQQLGIDTKLGTQVGVEVTTQELGHFLGWPMKYAERSNGTVLPGNDGPEWREQLPQGIFDEIRKRRLPDTRIVVDVPHPFSYFDDYRLDPVSLEPQSSIITLVNPLVSPGNFSGDFDAMELINAKGFDLIRRPTINELQFYSRAVDVIQNQLNIGQIDEPTFEHRRYLLETETTRRFLHKTTAEENAALAGSGNEVMCLCGSDGDCAAGLVCEPTTLTCVKPGTPPAAGATPPQGVGMCRALRGIVDDWFNMLNRGMVRTGVGGSDVHGLYDYEAGSPRTMLHTPGTTMPNLRSDDIVNAVFAHASVVTNGPMVRFHVDGTDIGGLETTGNGQAVTLSIHVEKAPWYDVDRVEVYRNGELIHWATACGGSKRFDEEKEPHSHPCLPQGDAVVAYDDQITDTPPKDAWYSVIALGLDGRMLGPVYMSQTLARFGTFELTQRIYDIIPTLGALRSPRYPSLYPTFPIAITNPIWVDVGGDGWHPPAKPASWCTSGRDYDCTNAPPPAP